MKALYVSIQARFLCTLTGLLVLSVVMLCVASWTMTGKILSNMRSVNLDIESRRILIEMQRRLSNSFNLLFQVSLTAEVQNITMGLPSEISPSDMKSLRDALTSFNVTDLKIYGPELNILMDSNYDGTPINSTVSKELYPLEYSSDIEGVVQKLTTKGLVESVPLDLSTGNNVSDYVISLTIPVLYEKELTTVLTSPLDLITRTDAPTIGFLAGLVRFLDAVPIEIDKTLYVVLARFNPDVPVVTAVAPLANLSNSGMRRYRYGTNLLLDQDYWKTLYTSGKPNTHGSSNGGIIAIAPLPAPYDDLMVYIEEQGAVMQALRQPLLKALIIAACAACLVGFLVLFLLNRWRTRNLVNLIDTTGRRKKALDESRKRVEKGSLVSPRLAQEEGPEGGEHTQCGDSTQPHSEPCSTVVFGDDEYDKKDNGSTTGSSWQSWRPWVRKRFAKSKRMSDHESGPDTLIATSYKPSSSLMPLHIKDEAVDMAIGIDSIFAALIRQYKVLEHRVQVRKTEISEAKHNADEANAAKSHFLARVTHELRTPLNGILGTASLCLDEQDLPQIHSSLKTIYKCGELLLHLLTDLLSFSQSESENVELDEQELMIEEITTQIVAIFREQTALNNITMDIKIDPECERQIVYGDINRILQVIFNLLSNSIKFTPPGGHIEFIITAKPIGDDEKRLVSCIVRDNGPGIAPHLQSRVFEAFVQGDINSKVRKAGVGLGLSICKQLAQRMGGSITLESELGKGAEFTFTVPLRYIGQAVNDDTSSLSKDANIWPEYEHYNTSTIMRKAEAELGVSRKHSYVGSSTPSSGRQSFDFQRQNSSSGPSSAPSVDDRAESTTSEKQMLRPPLQRGVSMRGSTVDPNLRVLVADDNKVNQEVMIRMLNLEGLHDITVADDGIEAIEKTKEALQNGTLFDIIFMDVQMPNCDGKRATQILREREISIPIIAVSAYASEENVEACIEAGMNLFLAKPLRRPSLHKLLEGLQDSKVFDTAGMANQLAPHI